MLKSKDINYFKYGEIENKKFWKRLGQKPDFIGKKIFNSRNETNLDYSNVLPYKLPKSIEKEVNKNIEFINKHKRYSNNNY